MPCVLPASGKERESQLVELTPSYEAGSGVAAVRTALLADRGHVCSFLFSGSQLCASGLGNFSIGFVDPQVHGSPFNQDMLKVQLYVGAF